ncbi:XylR family transcriptional regulator [Gimesia sp.]|uniref:XylR family transcriptional regulator n=1 Tax=Gimesia sp. TaxID=2024833 RepID=UPI000C37BC30|nr:XylR family transcriptional regulator [Gimesia sp.]MAX38849.1 XylR family transcriptional regulator [Gimesia sp.]HBL42255.1 XylR family transcriptional regulator [Planctomycetaceae bacterium]|tara:strand:- start:15305 stop:16465 length:1161 start_codon:yes stop_codon:yes gene_type:complete
MKTRPSIALLIESSNSYARGLLRGIMSYIHEHHSWSIYLPEHGRGNVPVSWLNNWHGDGIIARIENTKIAEAVVNAGVPAVDVSAARLAPSLPWVETDDRAIASLAARHLIDRGFQHYAFCGDHRFNWSRWRETHFQEYIQAAGFHCHTYPQTSGRKQAAPWEVEQKRLADWIRALPKPVGVMACYDIKAQQLLDVCRTINVAVPEEVAIIGVDNDEILCNLSEPPLSSVIPNTKLTGYEAAALLDRMIAGEAVSSEAQLIKPLGIATRQSTDIQAIDDKLISDAVRFIRQQACDGINVQDVLKSVPLSRRVLESRFQKIIGRSPHEEIMRIRLDRVKQLLEETELSLIEIAERTGFRHAEYLNVAFKKQTGTTPGSFRRTQKRTR